MSHPPESFDAMQKRIAFVQQHFGQQLCRFCGTETRGLLRIFTGDHQTFNAERNIDQLLEKQFVEVCLFEF